MTSAEGVTGLDKKQKSQHASVNNITNDANKDLLLIELVNGFVQEILRKGIAKYQEDINAQRPKVKVINFGLFLTLSHIVNFGIYLMTVDTKFTNYQREKIVI